MTPELLENVTAWFHTYTDSFFKGREHLRPMLLPKIEHNVRVSEFCRVLAEDLHWHEQDKITSQIIGLLHDIGRFSQFEDYGTFIDSDSVNHGKRGYDVVRRSDLLSSLSPSDRQIILDGIQYHNNRDYNRKTLPESLEFVKLVRDADKLDKYMIADEYLREQRNRVHSTYSLILESDGPVNREALEDIYQDRKISKKNIRTQMDFHLLQLSWIFDISYKPTFDRIFESGIIEKISAVLPDGKEIRAATDHVKTYLKEHIR